MTQDLNFKKKFVVIFVLLVTFELISHHSNIDSSQWLRKNIQWITHKVCREKPMV